MALKCVHKGCGKVFNDAEEPCVYHSGPPVFHEGQKGWACCKPRVLTFDEFLTIPPCTTGRHSTKDESQPPKAKETPKSTEAGLVNRDTTIAQPAVPEPPPQTSQIPQPPQATPPITKTDAQPQESDSDDPSKTIPPKTACRRRGCNVNSDAVNTAARQDEDCVHHPGHPIFHEGTKGWTCCKKRVLEFDEFLNLEGCKSKSKHLFVGKKKSKDQEEIVTNIRHDYYQTSSTVIASLFLKKIVKERSTVEFSSSTSIRLDLHTEDNKHYDAEIPLYGQIDTSKSTHKIMGTKLEISLAKADGLSWATLRSDEQKPNEIIQVRKASKS